MADALTHALEAASGTAAAGPLLERANELAALHDVLAAARAGSGRCLVLEAAPGLGKTTLVAAARAGAAAAGAAVQSARGSELEQAFSFGIVLQLFEPALRAAGPDRREELLRGAAGLSAPLFTGAGGDTEEEAFARFHGLHWLVAGLAEERPVVLAVDDAQWADVLSLRFLHYLLQRLDELPVAVVLAARPGAGDRHGRLMARLAGHALSRTLRLGPLSRSAVAELLLDRLGEDAAPELADAVAAATGGNPFLVGELVAAMRRGGVAPTREAAARVAELAGPAATTMTARLAALSPAAGTLARAVAVLGDGTRPRAAAELAEIEVEVAVEAADELAEAAILAAGPPLRFSHPLVRDAVARAIAPAALARAHGRAAELLEREEADPELIASHLLASDVLGEPQVTAALRRAAAGARSRGAPETAVGYLRGALAEPPDPAVVADLAELEARAGDEAAPSRAELALDLAQPGQSRAQLALRLALALLTGGRHREAVRTLDRGLSECEQDDLARTLAATRAAVGGLDHATRVMGGLDPILARTEAGTATSHERLMLAHGALAAALQGTSAAEARRLATAALAGASPQRLGAADIGALALAATALVAADALADAASALDDVIEAARRRGLVVQFATASHVRAHAHYRQGRLEEAIADAQSAVDAARYGWDPALPAAHAVLANALLQRGQIAAAGAALAVPGGEERWSETFTWNDLLEARGRLALARGDAAGALAEFEACGERLQALGTTHPGVVAWRAGAALAASALGDPSRAGRLADEDVTEARAFGAPRSLGLALRVAGVVAGGDRGIALLREAVDVLRDSEGRLEHAHALADLGATLLGERHRLAGQEPLREALDLAHRCRAEALERRVRDLLAEAGLRPRRPTISGRDALTPRELRLARMAAEGLTNREIAEALFITTKTVETHLARAYRKLGVRSRAQVSEALGPGSA